MKKEKRYLINTLLITLIIIIVGFFGMQYLLKNSVLFSLKIQNNSVKEEAKRLSKMIEFQFEKGISKETIKQSIQKSIEESHNNPTFISVIDWSGIEICHPDVNKIGVKTKSNSSILNANEEITEKDLFAFLKKSSAKKDNYEVVALFPVKNSDWIVASQFNIKRVKEGIAKQTKIFLLAFIITSLLTIVSLLVVIRFIGRHFEKKVEDKNEKLLTEVMNLSKLNANLNTQRTKLEQIDNLAPQTSKKRILTYLRNQLIPVDTNDIFFIKIDNTITKIYCFDGNIYTSNATLEEVYKTLDSNRFFRANRQYVISINVIEKILLYGKNQLKILLKNNSDDTIIISKNKASEFKKWLNS